MMDTNALARANAERWDSAKLARNFAPVAKRLVAPNAKARYQSVASKTGVPWSAIAVIHERECSQNWACSLAQGDPWDRVSIHVPSGRGPFRSWEEAAIDALANCPPYAARNKDWTIGQALTKLEEYNGLGYAARRLPSPYIWSGTDQYKSGKYVRDGVFDPNAVDSQLGCAGLLMAMMKLDPDVRFDDRKSAIAAGPGAAKQGSPSLPPSIANPSKGSIGAFVASVLAAIFRRK
jgi:lysozyme family protein